MGEVAEYFIVYVVWAWGGVFAVVDGVEEFWFCDW